MEILEVRACQDRTLSLKTYPQDIFSSEDLSEGTGVYLSVFNFVIQMHNGVRADKDWISAEQEAEEEKDEV